MPKDVDSNVMPEYSPELMQKKLTELRNQKTEVTYDPKDFKGSVILAKQIFDKILSVGNFNVLDSEEFVTLLSAFKDLVANEGAKNKYRIKYNRTPSVKDMMEYGQDEKNEVMRLAFSQAISSDNIRKGMGKNQEEQLKKLKIFGDFIYNNSNAGGQGKHLNTNFAHILIQLHTNIENTIKKNTEEHYVNCIDSSLPEEVEKTLERYALEYKLKALYPKLHELLMSDNLTLEQKQPLIEIFEKIATVPVCQENFSLSMPQVAKKLAITLPTSTQIFTKEELEKLENKTKDVLAEAEAKWILSNENSNNELIQKMKNMQCKLENLPESYKKEINNFLNESEEIFGEDYREVNPDVKVDYDKLEQLNLQGEKLLKKLPDIAGLEDLVKEILRTIEEVMHDFLLSPRTNRITH